MTITAGVHHIGLAVSQLEATAAFFTGLPGWREVRRDADYPAIFVSDGAVMLSLWQVRDPATANAFDKHNNVGLHHLALRVNTLQALEQVHEQLCATPGVTIEFAPELVRQGPARHMMCYEPSGIRVEFFWSGEAV